MSNNPDISLIIPLFNEDESIGELCQWIQKVMADQPMTHEIICIDDGSTDKSWEYIVALSEEISEIKAIKFNRNYGKSAALNTGFKHATGTVVITMDADLQDSPDEIPALYSMIVDQDLDLVSGWKKKRHDPITKTIPSKFFNFVTRIFSGIKLHDFNCGLKAYKNEVVKTIDVYGEMHRYIPFIAKWHGFTRIDEKVVEHRARKYGTTKFGLERFIFGFLDLLSITFVSKFKKRPMHFFGTFGTLSFLFGSGVTLWLIFDKMYNIYFKLPVRDIVDQPLFFLALVAVIVGIQLFLAGFLAELITQSGARRDDYTIHQKLNLPE